MMLMIPKIKFVATFLVASVYPSLVYGIGLIAALVMPPPGSEWPFAANVLMWVGILTMLASLALLLKKLFGRQPSLNEILSGLVSVAVLNDYKEEVRLRSVGLEKQISDARHSFDERLNTDLVRYERFFSDMVTRGEDRDRVIAEMRDSISRLHERTETHIRKIDQYDTKMDNLLREVSAAAALLKGATQGR